MKHDELKAIRHVEYLADKTKARSALEEYWAGSAWASAIRDVKAGRMLKTDKPR